MKANSTTDAFIKETVVSEFKVKGLATQFERTFGLTKENSLKTAKSYVQWMDLKKARNRKAQQAAPQMIESRHNDVLNQIK